MIKTATYSKNGLYYRPQTRLREGNVFTDVCLSMGDDGSNIKCIMGYVTRWYGTYRERSGRVPPGHQTWRPPPSEIWCWSLKTCSNLFTWDPPLPGARSGRGHWNQITYGFQAGSTHPTGMLSCYSSFSSNNSLLAPWRKQPSRPSWR